MALGRYSCDLELIFKICIKDRHLKYFMSMCPQLNVTRSHWWLVSIGSSNGLVPSGNKPLLEPMSTQIYVSIVYQWLNENVWRVNIRCDLISLIPQHSVVVVAQSHWSVCLILVSIDPVFMGFLSLSQSQLPGDRFRSCLTAVKGWSCVLWPQQSPIDL